MNRWLLNTFTTWELAVIVVGAFVLLGVVGLWVVDRWLPEFRKGEHNDFAGILLGVLAAVYGVVLAFVIVALYDDFRKTEGDVRAEATTLSMVYRDTRGLGEPTAGLVDRQIGRYIRIVLNDEWPKLRNGHDSEAAWAASARLYPILQAYKPRTEAQSVFYTEAVGRLNDFIGARRERITDAESSLPPTFEILLVGGAVMLVAFTFLLGLGNPRVRLTLVISVAALLGFNLLVGLVLDYPFAGQVSVSNKPFTSGALVHYIGARSP